MASHLHGNWSKISSQGKSSYSYCYPGNKWKPVESLKVPSLREEPAEKKWEKEEEMLLGRQAEMMVLKRKLCF
ncbi:MAG: hypothetical protein WBZ20_02955 [Nitrososphaeraceae archaeon]